MSNERATINLAKTVTSKYGLKECLKCANHLMRVFKDRGIHGQQLKLSTKGGRGFIMLTDPKKMAELSSLRDFDISENGNHYGVHVGELIFDNIFKEGIPKEDWEKQFDCDVHQFVVTTIKVF